MSRVILHLACHLTDRLCPECGQLLSYEPADPRDLPPADVGVLGCEDCGHAEPAAIVRDYERSIGRDDSQD